MKIKIKIDEQNLMPFKKFPYDAGWDLRAKLTDSVKIRPFETIKIETGVRIEIPQGYVGDIRPRSSMATKGLTAEYGTIDCGYIGEIQIVLTNNGSDTHTIEPYDRIAQLVIVPIPEIEFEEVDSLEQTDRGTGGFGSTGIK